jgi:hypothetical protein
MAVVSDFDFSVENIFLETGGAGDEECDAGWEGVGDVFAGAGAGAGLEPMLRDMVWGGPRPLNALPGTNSNAPALSLLMVVGTLDLLFIMQSYIPLIS